MAIPLPHPNPIVLREALRGLRHGMRRSRTTLRGILPFDVLPWPAAQVADTVFQGLDTLAEEIDVAGTGLAKRVLGVGHFDAPTLNALTMEAEPEATFANAVYVALNTALRRMGDGDAFVSEATAYRTYIEFLESNPDHLGESVSDAAADLTLRLLAAQVIRDIAPLTQARVAASHIAPVAIFAALLWLLSDRLPGDSEDALNASVDLSVVVADEIAAACAASNCKRLAHLFDQFASHV